MSLFPSGFLALPKRKFVKSSSIRGRRVLHTNLNCFRPVREKRTDTANLCPRAGTACYCFNSAHALHNGLILPMTKFFHSHERNSAVA